jgi:DegV family protein with EDD domain
MRIAVVTDSTCDLPEETLYQYNIKEIPAKVVVQNKVIYDNRLEFDRLEFYRDQVEGKDDRVRIESPTVEEFLKLYRKMCLDFDMVLSIHESSRFSDTVKNARAAVVEGAESFKKMRLQKNLGTPFLVRVIDSKSISLGLGLLVLRAAELVTGNISFLRLANAIEMLADQIFVYVVPNELVYLRSAKNIFKVSVLDAGFSLALDLKPIFVVNRGEFKMIDKKRGYDLAAAEAMKLASQQLHNKDSYDKLGFVYSGRTAKLDEMQAVSDFRAELAGMGLGTLVSTLNPYVGSFIGPNSVAVALINADIKMTDLVELK